MAKNTPTRQVTPVIFFFKGSGKTCPCFSARTTNKGLFSKQETHKAKEKKPSIKAGCNLNQRPSFEIKDNPPKAKSKPFPIKVILETLRCRHHSKIISPPPKIMPAIKPAMVPYFSSMTVKAITGSNPPKKKDSAAC